MAMNPKQKLIALATLVFLFISIIVGGLTAISVSSKKSADGRMNYYVDSNANLTLASIDDNTPITFAQIEAAMFSLDVLKNEAKLMLNFELFGALNARNNNGSKPLQDTYSQSPYNINLTIGTQFFSFPANRPLISQPVTLIIGGEVNKYPFDTLYIGYVMYGSYALPGQVSQPLKINLIQDGLPTGYQVSYSAILDDDTDTEITAIGSITRTATIRTISVFFAFLMWGLAFSCAIYTASVYVFEKKAEPPILGFHIALLFAMPAVRNAMPLAPPVGCLIDQMVLVWVMMILACCVLALFMKLIFQTADGGFKKLVTVA
ncbi:hypothetical protein BCR33DRAFT_773791 [Rhizoclosmatium globosum]|uniref:DUF4436 domain-containing protein n=1 Tax=Rhizoclosmatium globosum TaxID=329046 RepID=A0A1Y2AVX7_9FUNG|nr:hypothetical protein BCR33DRAFT_773791 [Rhizoclosmatium globosum]|eukprot:ORY26450.1 hypothetical protein BCR33DRAFT_773791 [Rhizoclosmatium globosum]